MSKSIVLDRLKIKAGLMSKKYLVLLILILLGTSIHTVPYVGAIQYSNPDSDIYNNGWTTAPIWSKIDETPFYNDGDYVQSVQNPSPTNTFVVSLSEVSDPALSSDHIMRIRTRRSGGIPGDNIDLELRQDYVSEASQGTLIASMTDISISASYTTFSYTLSGAEADSITDYSSLYYRVIPQMPSMSSDPRAYVSWAEFEVPDVPPLITITSNPTGSGFVEVDGSPITTPRIFGWEESTSHTLEALSPVSGGSGIQHIYESWSDGGAQTHTYTTPSSDETVTATYRTEYYLTVSSPHGTASNEGWYLSGATAYAGLDTDIVGDSSTRYTFTQWSGDASGTNYAQSDPILMDAPKTATADWQTQHYLTVVSLHGNPTSSSWVNQGSDFYTAVTSPDDIYACYGYRIDGGDLQTGTNHTFTNVQAPHEIEYFWYIPPIQYYLNVSTPHGTVSGEGWYDEGSTVEISVSPEYITEDAVRYTFEGWTGDYNGGANPHSVLMDDNKTITAQWQTRHLINVISQYGSPTPSGWPLEGENYETNVATPDEDQICIGYKIDNGPTQSGISYTFENIQTNHTIEYLWTNSSSLEHRFLIVNLEIDPLEIDVSSGPVKVAVNAIVTTNDGNGTDFVYSWEITGGELNIQQCSPVDICTVEWTLSEEGSQKITCTVSSTGYSDGEASASIEAMPEFHHIYVTLLFSLSMGLFIFIRKRPQP